MKKRNVLVGEWFFELWGPERGRSGPVTVSVKNADRPDLRFAQALAKAVEVWIASGGRR